MARCRCHSRKQEHRCCGPLHNGQRASTPLALMRSRYAAYAKGLVEYIIETTDPQGPHWQTDVQTWSAEIRRFCSDTRFEGLTILSSSPPEHDSATVSFHVQLSRGSQDVSFSEKSTFRLVEGNWKYTNGEPTP